ncbi:MAG: glycosyltransferase [Lentisphaerae bacterium]|nr:glycosyltransferase [Lentisphaerota bacterium]
MNTSVIVTVYNRPAMLIACLRALALSSERVDEVVVSDDGSSEDNVRRMRSVFPDFPFPVRYVWQEDHGYRLAAARNNALRQVTGDYIISLDCDILLMPDAVMAHLRAARSGWFLAANRGGLAQAETQMALQQAMSPRLLEVLWQSAARGHLRRAQRQFQHNVWLRRLGLARRYKPKILGCHFSIFREDIERVNGFDETYVGWGHEDDDFAMRLHLAGVRGRSVILEARAVHLWHPAADAGPTTSPNQAYFRRRHVPAFCAQGLRGGDKKNDDGRQTPDASPEKREEGRQIDNRRDTEKANVEHPTPNVQRRIEDQMSEARRVQPR